MKYILQACSLLLLTYALPAQSSRRPLIPGDIYRLKTIGTPTVSPEGKWVAYTITSIDSAKDNRNTDIWMISWDGKESVQLTSSPDAETAPKWSPDGKYLSFLSSRVGDRSQVWLLNRRGGEAIRVTDEKKGVERLCLESGQQKAGVGDERFSGYCSAQQTQTLCDRSL